MEGARSGVSRRAFMAGIAGLMTAGACSTATSREQYSPVTYGSSGVRQPASSQNVRIYNASYTQPSYGHQSYQVDRFGRYSSDHIYSLTGKISHIVVKKSARKMYLLSGRNVVREYDIELGFNPIGHKRVQGDGRTPEGTYYIDRRNAHSKFYLSLGLSYPNSYDVASAASIGRSAGGDIFIHGDPNGRRPRSGDWTNGCIAVTNEEMDELWQLIPLRTPITVRA